MTENAKTACPMWQTVFFDAHPLGTMTPLLQHTKRTKNGIPKE